MTTIEDLLAALKPFALLCEMHDEPSIPDSSGMIFPGSKALVTMGDLRRARRVYLEGWIAAAPGKPNPMPPEPMRRQDDCQDDFGGEAA